MMRKAENTCSYLKVVEKAYIFLIKYVCKNRENQNQLLPHIAHFYDDMDHGVHAVELIAAIFDDNESIMQFQIYPLVKRLATTISKIDVESPKKATLMSFLNVFMQYKNGFLPNNQYLLLTEFTKQSMNADQNLFKGTEGRTQLALYMAEMKYQYQKFIQNEKLEQKIDMPPELDYTISYIKHISRCCFGKIVISETRA